MNLINKNEFLIKFPNGIAISKSNVLNCLKSFESNKKLKFLDIFHVIVQLK